MLVCVLASRKGRCGKTTLASHLAVEAGRAGAGPVAVVGLNPMSGSSGWWDARHAAEPMLPRVETSLADTLKVLLEGGIQAVFVDTPPSVGPEVATAFALADIVLVPCKPSPDELRVVGRTVEAVTLAGKPMVFAINMTKPRTCHTAEVAVALSQHGTLTLQFVADRTDYAAAKADGLTAQELEPNEPSANEISQRASKRSCGIVAYADTDAGMESTSGQRDSRGMSGCPRRATDRVHRSREAASHLSP